MQQTAKKQKKEKQNKRSNNRYTTSYIVAVTRKWLTTQALNPIEFIIIYIPIFQISTDMYHA